ARIARLVGDLTRRNLRCRLAHGWPRRCSHSRFRPRPMLRCVFQFGRGAMSECMHELLAPLVQDLVERRDHDQRQQCRCYDATDDGTSQRCAEVGSLTEAERYGNHAGDERERRHENRTQAYPAFFDSRVHLAKSTSRIAFFATIPISRITPIIDMMLSVPPVTSNASTTPISDNGSDNMIASGSRNDPNCTTRMRYMSRIASPSAATIAPYTSV